MASDVKHMIQVENSVYDEIKEYCDLNNLKINVFINELIQKGFMIEKYGDTPFTSYNVAPKVDDSLTIDGIKYTRDELIGIISEYNLHFMKLGPNSIIHSTEEMENIDELIKTVNPVSPDFFAEQTEEKEESVQPEQPIVEEKPVEVKPVKRPTKHRLK